METTLRELENLLGILRSELDNDNFYNSDINAGGCGLSAFLIQQWLKQQGIASKLVTIGESGSKVFEYVNNCINTKEPLDEDYIMDIVYFKHILVMVDENTLIDSNGINNIDFSIDRTEEIKLSDSDFLKVLELSPIWNSWFEEQIGSQTLIQYFNNVFGTDFRFEKIYLKNLDYIGEINQSLSA